MNFLINEDHTFFSQNLFKASNKSEAYTSTLAPSIYPSTYLHNALKPNSELSPGFRACYMENYLVNGHVNSLLSKLKLRL